MGPPQDPSRGSQGVAGGRLSSVETARSSHKLVGYDDDLKSRQRHHDGFAHRSRSFETLIVGLIFSVISSSEVEWKSKMRLARAFESAEKMVASVAMPLLRLRLT